MEKLIFCAADVVEISGFHESHAIPMIPTYMFDSNVFLKDLAIPIPLKYGFQTHKDQEYLGEKYYYTLK